ncbi:hypothetical protein, partial [Arthrobacter psychrolactophilus]|uniref:hypothetical protein n=1 Tax=Arthrobacter psychrolactophilus TaxID=92442 RepID=UPI001C64BEA0
AATPSTTAYPAPTTPNSAAKAGTKTHPHQQNNEPQPKDQNPLFNTQITSTQDTTHSDLQDPLKVSCRS